MEYRRSGPADRGRRHPLKGQSACAARSLDSPRISEEAIGSPIDIVVVSAGGGTAMEMRIFGRTAMQLSVLGSAAARYGLMVPGDPLDQERTIAQAITAGVNYFDTALQYGNGESEKNLGRVAVRCARIGPRCTVAVAETSPAVVKISKPTRGCR
jgi:predicted alpha/beta-hydrolase family hydrolase